MIHNANNIHWIFHLIDHITKEARVFSVLNDRIKNNLMPIIKNNIEPNSNGKKN